MFIPLSRRSLIRLSLASTVAATMPVDMNSPAHAEGRVLRIGFQKYGTLILLKGKGILEQVLAEARRAGTAPEVVAQLEAFCDPGKNLGQAGVMVDRVLAARA